MRNILSVSQFDNGSLETLFESAREIQQRLLAGEVLKRCEGKLIANLFYEPSTRTSSSFDAAMKRLGGDVVAINNVHYSSVSKGETLEDTIRTLEQYTDAIVLRHPEVGAAARAAAVAEVPIINAGDGVGEHPTQALLDLFTILQEQKKVDGLTIGLLGDLENGRTVHSLAEILNNYSVNLTFIAPDELQYPESDLAKLTNSYQKTNSLDDVIHGLDVLYVTRIQKERMSEEKYERVKDGYVITAEEAAKMKPEATIMHPLPRVGEIAAEVDSDPRAAYFRQMKNGLYVRMALLEHVLQ